MLVDTVRIARVETTIAYEHVVHWDTWLLLRYLYYPSGVHLCDLSGIYACVIVLPAPTLRLPVELIARVTYIIPLLRCTE